MLLFRSLCLVAILTQTVACAGTSPQRILSETKPNITETALSAVDYADLRLKEEGLSREYIHSLHSTFIKGNTEWRESAKRIIELNVFGFLSRSDYSVHDTPNARKHISRYLKDHRKSFKEAHNRYAVSSSSISSLMWIETRHGKVTGTFPIAWVYYALVIGAHPDFIKEMVNLIPAKIAKDNPKNLTSLEVENKIVDRCRTKSLWALDEMKAVSFIREANFFNPFTTRASFAGAFGLGQFIPSTYLKFSESLYRKQADLFKPSDAILSIAHFLKDNGWEEKEPEAKVKALYSYNHSKDYGAVILKLAEEVAGNAKK